MSAAASLYVGHTTHQRLKPRPHRFRYGLFHLLIDIDRLGEAFGGVKLLRHGRFGLFSFHPGDHGARDGGPLRPWVEAKLAKAGLTATASSIRLLTFPRVLGFVFNPISIFFVYGPDEALEAVIYEVNNTFGETHAYVAPAEGLAVERQSADKVFYVSPFFRVEGRYCFSVSPPQDEFKLVIVKELDGQADFIASLSETRAPLTDPRLLSLCFTMPLMTLGVVVAIYWEALRLWIKGAPFEVRPRGPKAGASVGRAGGASVQRTPVASDALGGGR